MTDEAARELRLKLMRSGAAAERDYGSLSRGISLPQPSLPRADGYRSTTIQSGSALVSGRSTGSLAAGIRSSSSASRSIPMQGPLSPPGGSAARPSGGFYPQGARFQDDRFDQYDEGDDSYDEEDDDDEFVPLPPPPNEFAPVVPPQMLEGSHKRLIWSQHPAHGVVLSLLFRRGVVPDLHKPIVEYHMAEAFLDCIAACMRGSYFVRYAPKNASPKERYFNIQLLPDKNERLQPYLCYYIHRTAVQMIDKVPLDDLVGVTTGHSSISFRRWLISHDIIKGCMQGHRKSRMSTRGCFSLWFYDRVGQRPRSVDLLTNNMGIFQLWVRTMEGILAVNSTCLSGTTDAAQEMQHLLRLAQHHSRHYEEDNNLFAAQFADA